MSSSDELLTVEVLASFADTLARSALPAAEVMGPGLTEDQIRHLCAEASLEPSHDALTWFGFWHARPHDGRGSTASRFGELLPGFHAVPLEVCVRTSVTSRQFAEDTVRRGLTPGMDADNLWPHQWLQIFSDGMGGSTVLDCGAPTEPSLLRDCFRESFSGPEWGDPIAALATWVRNGTRWVTEGQCQFDAGRDQWLPLDLSQAYWPHFDVTAEPNPQIPGSSD